MCLWPTDSRALRRIIKYTIPYPPPAFPLFIPLPQHPPLHPPHPPLHPPSGSSQLRNRGITNTPPGRGGGTWTLTVAGKTRVQIPQQSTNEKMSFMCVQSVHVQWRRRRRETSRQGKQTVRSRGRAMKREYLMGKMFFVWRITDLFFKIYGSLHIWVQQSL